MVPVAAHQVVTQLWLLSSLVVDSVAIAGQSLVAVQVRCCWAARQLAAAGWLGSGRSDVLSRCG